MPSQEEVFIKYAIEDSQGRHIPSALLMRSLHALGFQPSRTELAGETGPVTLDRFKLICRREEKQKITRLGVVDALKVFAADSGDNDRIRQSELLFVLKQGSDCLSEEEIQGALRLSNDAVDSGAQRAGGGEENGSHSNSSDPWINIEKFADEIVRVPETAVNDSEENEEDEHESKVVAAAAPETTKNTQGEAEPTGTAEPPKAREEQSAGGDEKVKKGGCCSIS